MKTRLKTSSELAFIKPLAAMKKTHQEDKWTCFIKEVAARENTPQGDEWTCFHKSSCCHEEDTSRRQENLFSSSQLPPKRSHLQETSGLAFIKPVAAMKKTPQGDKQTCFHQASCCYKEDTSRRQANLLSSSKLLPWRRRLQEASGLAFIKPVAAMKNKPQGDKWSCFHQDSCCHEKSYKRDRWTCFHQASCCHEQDTSRRQVDLVSPSQLLPRKRHLKETSGLAFIKPLAAIEKMPQGD
ncbi:hypothetical protein MRX96_002500 [Rhipicephalus microplus]